jgi:hypothetical protein
MFQIHGIELGYKSLCQFHREPVLHLNLYLSPYPQTCLKRVYAKGTDRLCTSSRACASPCHVHSLGKRSRDRDGHRLNATLIQSGLIVISNPQAKEMCKGQPLRCLFIRPRSKVRKREVL